MRLLDGRTFEVKHPELCIVGRRDLFLFISHNGGEPPVDDWVILSLVSIASLRLDRAA